MFRVHDFSLVVILFCLFNESDLRRIAIEADRKVSYLFDDLCVGNGELCIEKVSA